MNLIGCFSFLFCVNILHTTLGMLASILFYICEPVGCADAYTPLGIRVSSLFYTSHEPFGCGDVSRPA